MLGTAAGNLKLYSNNNQKSCIFSNLVFTKTSLDI